MRQAASIKLDVDEGRFILTVDDTHDGLITFDIHACALELYDEVTHGIAGLCEYAAEAKAARATLPPSYEPGEAYTADDPKHPDWHDAMADMWDRRPGK